MSKKNKNKGKILDFPGGGNQRKEKTGGVDPLWSQAKRQWPLIAVAAVISVMLFKDTRHIKQTLNVHKETLETMNDHITSLYENSEYSKPESLMAVTEPKKGDQKNPRDPAFFSASGLKAEIRRAAEKAFLFWASILLFLAPAVIVYYAIKYWNDKKLSLKNI